MSFVLEEAIRILKEKSQAMDIRMDAILFIVNHFETEYFHIFEDILADETELPEIQSGAALALAKLGGERPFHILRQYVSSPNPVVKQYVLHALGRLGNVDAAPLLIEALKDKSNSVFAAAAEALGDLGKPVVPYLVRLLDHGGAEDARCVAAWQLGELRYQEALPTLVKILEEQQNIELMALCIWAIGQIGEPEQNALRVLSWARAQEDPELRLRAELAIKKVVRNSN